MKGITNSVIGNSNEGSLSEIIIRLNTVYAKNLTSYSPVINDKVLIKKGLEASQEYTTAYNSTNAYIQPFIFYDNNTIICGIGQKAGHRLNYIDNSWIDTPISFSYNVNEYNYEYLENGYISLQGYRVTSSSNGRGLILNTDGLKRLADSGTYIGSYNDIHYVGTLAGSNDFYTFDFTTLTQGENVIDGDNSRRNSFLRKDKILLYNGYKVEIYQNIDGVWKKISLTALNDTDDKTINIIGVTGLEVGDYLFSITQYLNYSSQNTGNESYLKLYKIQEDYTIKEVSLPILDWLKQTNCSINYDIRNNTLMIGTSTGVFAYKYEDGVFKTKTLNLDLPSIDNSGDTVYGVYRACLSPFEDRILVSLPSFSSGTYKDEFKIYQLGSDSEWAIVDNRTLNYQYYNVYTGVATGKKDSDGNFEVKTVIPATIKPNIGFDYEDSTLEK